MDCHALPSGKSRNDGERVLSLESTFDINAFFSHLRASAVAVAWQSKA
ncbi:hypothetical protein [Helicobacter canis]|nr:hypothetical protein [Helicobacter canis]